MWRVAELLLNLPDCQVPQKLRVRFYFYHLFCFGDQFCDPLQAASAGIEVLAGWKPARATVLESQLCHSPVCSGNIPNLCPCHPIMEVTCRTCEVPGGTQNVLVYRVSSDSTETWIFILLRIRRKNAFPAVLWRALLVGSPFFLGLFLLVWACVDAPSLHHCSAGWPPGWLAP